MCEIVRTDLFAGMTLCQSDPMGLFGVYVVEDGEAIVRQAFVPLRIFAECAEVAERMKWEIAEHGTPCPEHIARVWFPDIGARPYKRDLYRHLPHPNDGLNFLHRLEVEHVTHHAIRS